MRRKNATHRTALRIAIIVTAVSLIPFAAIWYYSTGIPTWVLPVSVIFMFFTTFLSAEYLVSRALYQKLNPVYRFLFNTDYSKIPSRKERSRLVDNVEENVRNQAETRSNEILELKQNAKYRKEFIGNVSHELKTPIFNIQGYVLTLLDGGLEDPSINRLYLERCEKSINRMVNIVDDLISISKLESEELSLQYEKFNLIPLVKEIFELQDIQAKTRNISLVFKTDPGIKPIVYADRKNIMEALNNLIDNSIKYGKKKGCTTVSFVDTEDKIIVQVADNGVGIAEKDQSRIFERFFRTDKSRSRDQGGTGLGLSIVKHIIEAHNQTVHLQSEPEQGSVFSFSLDKAK